MGKFASLLFDGCQALDNHLAKDVSDILIHDIKLIGSATLVVSGGSTPINFFQVLSEIDLPWDKVVITLADERWVNASHSDSNERLVRENLLINKAANARFLPLKTEAEDAESGVAELEPILSAMARFSVVILGMGSDGHTASLFPGTATLDQGVAMDSGKSCIAVMPVHAVHQRISMTLPRLLNTDNLFIHITGNEKKSVFEKAYGLDDPQHLPISAVLHQHQIPITLYWCENVLV